MNDGAVMNEKKTYPPGVPCWVETLQPDPRAALAFYGALFGWDGIGPGAMPDGGEYFVARLHGDDVAGIATLPPGGIAEPAWTTYIRVDELETSVRRVLAAGGRVVVAPLDTPPAGRIAIVEAPTGGTFGLWEPGERAGAQRINEPGAWAMSALRTRDARAALPFYETVFGWVAEPFADAGANGALLRLPGYVGGLPQQPVPRDVVAVAIEDDRADAEYWSVDFWIDDVDAAVERIAQRGGVVIAPPFDIAAFRRAVVADPAGAICSISQLLPERLS
jgi:predicted enzyme related to lactoylglutathione lyase